MNMSHQYYFAILRDQLSMVLQELSVVQLFYIIKESLYLAVYVLYISTRNHIVYLDDKVLHRVLDEV